MAKSHKKKSNAQQERAQERHKERLAAAKAQQSKSTKRMVIGAVILLALVIAFFSVYNSIKVTTDGLEPLSLYEISEYDSVKGNGSVLVHKYSDFQCPACKNSLSIVADMLAQYGDDVTFVYRHFPLSSILPKGTYAAQAVEAARLQGNFWEMHDIIFERQDEWSAGNERLLFSEYAQEIGLDVAQFDVDVISPGVRAVVSLHSQSGHALGVSATPTFFVNGRQIQLRTTTDLAQAVERELVQ